MVSVTNSRRISELRPSVVVADWVMGWTAIPYDLALCRAKALKSFFHYSTIEPKK